MWHDTDFHFLDVSYDEHTKEDYERDTLQKCDTFLVFN